jgi:hypothetical protein
MKANRAALESGIGGAMRHCLSLILLILAGSLIAGQQPAEAEDHPHAVVSPSSWDYGYIPQKSTVSHVYYLHNSGTAPLIVSKIDAGCDCTFVSGIDGPIAPGDSAAVVVTFRTGRYSKGVKKAAKIHTDESQEAIHHLRYKAFVIKPGEATGDISVIPQKLNWNTDEGAFDFKVDTLRIVNNGGDSVAVALLGVPDDIIDAIDFPPGLASGEQADVFLHLADRPAETSPALSLTLSFIGQDTTIVTIPIEIDE